MKGVVFAGALLASLSVAFPAAAAGTGAVAMPSADAAGSLKANTFMWQDVETTDPVRVIVSIPDQRAYAYRGETLIGIATVSTGREGKDTPVGYYPILQKEQVHKSNLYNSAPMPYMQRLTWDGIALHAGRNPGFPDSHGCVRLPAGFAKALFSVTTLGSAVEVVDYPVDADAPPAPLPPQPVVPSTDLETARANGSQLATVVAAN